MISIVAQPTVPAALLLQKPIGSVRSPTAHIGDRQRGSFLERAVMELTSERAREWRGILSGVAEEAYAS